MYLPATLLVEPVAELGEAGRGVGEDTVTEFAAITSQAGVELEFRHVEAERW
jgi:hypothetical protein